MVYFTLFSVKIFIDFDNYVKHKYTVWPKRGFIDVQSGGLYSNKGFKCLARNQLKNKVNRIWDSVQDYKRMKSAAFSVNWLS